MTELEIIQKLYDGQSLKKHKRQLEQCNRYISAIETNAVSTADFLQIEKYAQDTYDDIKKDDPLIAAANTCPPRNIDEVRNLKMNLEAIRTMLIEVIAKESEKVLE
ncbi:MAG: hypothetical protein E7302_13405 [Butyrivibrio sp.]|nr:hypothetical protein [Butyrivibrio sp.]